MALGDQDIDSFKHAHESNTEWALRKRFLEAHQDKYDLNRLLCLASCFINIECYGCKYPGPVMVEINGLMEEIKDDVEHFRKEVKSVNQIRFVKSSDSEEKASTADSCRGENTVVAQSPPSTKSDYIKHLNFVKSAESVGGDLSNTEVPAPPKTGMAFVKAVDSYKSTDVTEHAGSMADPSVTTEAATETNPFALFASLGSSTNHGAKSKDISSSRASTVSKQSTVSRQIESSNEKDESFHALSEQVAEVCASSRAHTDNAISILHMVMNKSPLEIDVDFVPGPNGFSCTIQIDHVHIAEGKASNKKNAKLAAYTEAVALLRKPGLRVVQTEQGRQELRSGAQRRVFPQPVDQHSAFPAKLARYDSPAPRFSNRGGPRGRGQRGGGRFASPPVAQSFKSLNDFIIVQHILSVSSGIATSVLHQSAEFNKMPIQYDFREEPQAHGCSYRCVVTVGTHTVADVTGQQKLATKNLAAETALADLRRKCWTIQIKQAADADGCGVSRDEFIGNLQKETTAIPDSNIGSKLLKMMGWEGGGIGKEGTGIAEPVKVNTVINREGLGLQSEKGISRDFLPHVKEIIMDYARSDRQDDLVFSPDFTKDERALAHKEAQRLGLKTHSHGSGAQRHLVISRKRTANQLFSHILQSGGETNKYVLLAPGSTPQS